MPFASTHTPKLVLASASPRRQELISLLGLPVRILPSRVDEDTPDHWSPSQIVEGLSARKAFAVKEELLSTDDDDSCIIVGSDTIVVLNGKVMGKPRDVREAEQMLRQLAGETHEVYTGVTCFRVTDAKTVTTHRITKVKMRNLT
jgi:septum formation protein